MVPSSLVAVVGRTVLRDMAVASFLSADELAQSDRTVLDCRGTRSAPNSPLVFRKSANSNLAGMPGGRLGHWGVCCDLSR